VSECPDVKNITNDGLTRSGTGCFIAIHLATLGGLNICVRVCV